MPGCKPRCKTCDCSLCSCNQIKNLYEYYRQFDNDKNKIRKALDVALDIRKFEIELYWRRSLYFWTILTITFSAYFLVIIEYYNIANSNSHYKDIIKYVLLIISLIGTSISAAWYMVNRGSKYWQENWERQVDCLEGPIIGPLYKLNISDVNKKFLNLGGSYRFSVSRINAFLSLYIFLTWVTSFAFSFIVIYFDKINKLIDFFICIYIFITILFFLQLAFCSYASKPGERRYIDFKISPLKSSSRL